MPYLYTLRRTKRSDQTASLSRRRAAVVAAKPDLSTLKKADLVSLASEQGVETSGTKAEIIERLSDG